MATTIGAAALALTGCSLIGTLVGGDPGVVEGEGVVTDAFEIKVGDCLNDAAAGDEVSAVPLVACSEPHDSEVYASLQMTDGDFPGEDAIYDFADAGCIDEFGDFVGVEYDLSTLYITWYNPIPAGWALGDREVLCVIYEVDESGEPIQTTGSLAGVAR